MEERKNSSKNTQRPHKMCQRKKYVQNDNKKKSYQEITWVFSIFIASTMTGIFAPKRIYYSYNEIVSVRKKSMAHYFPSHLLFHIVHLRK
jgi:hypothetical protein